MIGLAADQRSFLKARGSSDVAAIKRIDRLARSTSDLRATVQQIDGKDGRARSLVEARADPSASTGRRTIGRPAGVERDVICTRTAGDSAQAKARG